MLSVIKVENNNAVLKTDVETEQYESTTEAWAEADCESDCIDDCIAGKMTFIKPSMSVIDVFITLSVIAILMFVSNMIQFSDSGEDQLADAVQNYTDLFEFAREEAIKRGYTVVACQTRDRFSCSNAFESGSHWIVYAVKVSNNGMLTEKHVLMRKEVLAASSRTLSVSGGLYRVDFDNFGYALLYRAPLNSEVYPIMLSYHDSSKKEREQNHQVSRIALYFDAVGKIQRMQDSVQAHVVLGRAASLVGDLLVN